MPAPDPPAAPSPEPAGRSLAPDLTASLLLIGAFVVFTAMGVMIRIVAETMAVIVVIFLRQALTMVLLAPLFWINRAQIRHPSGLKMHALRGISAIGSMFCGLSAVVYIPFADATAIQMAEVLFTTALAALLLGETVGWRRWGAAAVGFVGVLVMIRPFGGAIEPYAVVALVGALFGAVAVISLRLGSSHDTVATVLFYQGVVILIGTAPLAWWAWTTPTREVLYWILAMSVAMGIGQWLFTTAMRTGKASSLAPLNYLRVLMMGGTGYLLYGETPTLATLIGGLLIVGAASYTLHRNAVRAPRRVALGEAVDPR